MGLSQQLSDSQQQLTQLTAALEQARAHLQAQQQALAQASACCGRPTVLAALCATWEEDPQLHWHHSDSRPNRRADCLHGMACCSHRRGRRSARSCRSGQRRQMQR